MLSLKASKADNFYYGTVEDEKKRKQKEKEKKKRNPKKYDKIKFEVPYTIICNNCKNYIYKGERFNSERTKAGYYFNICFYTFLFYCKHCNSTIVFETNPKDFTYDIKEGARQKNEQFNNILTEKGKRNFSHFNFENIKKKRANPFLLLEQRVLQDKNLNNQTKTQFNSHIYSEDDTKTQLKKTVSSKHSSSHSSSHSSRSSRGSSCCSRDSKKGSYNASDNDNQSGRTKGEVELERIRRSGTNDTNDGRKIEVLNEEEEEEEEEEEDMNDVIKETYERNAILKYDYKCNCNLRKQLRDIKKNKIKKREQNQKKNIFINILESDFEDELSVKNFISLSQKHKKKVKEKKRYIKSIKMMKKSSIFDKKYLKKTNQK